jgi:hypothetical protein
MKVLVILTMLVLSAMLAAACGDPEGAGGASGHAEGQGEPKGQAPPPATEAGRVAVSGQLWSHPLGYRFRYPRGWRLQEVGEDALSLIPPDVKRNAQGPTEVFVAVGAPAEGQTDPGSPQVVSLADQLMRSSFPFLGREGGVERGRHGGRPSAVLTWKGKAPTGDSYRARMWISVLKDAAIGLAAICPESSFEARRPMIEAIFSTFHFEEPARDPSVAGTWRHESTYMSGEFSSVTVRYMGLSPDGRATWGSKLHAGMSHTDSGGNFTGSTSAESSGAEATGRWTGANKKLYIVWDSGQEEEYDYYVEGSSMMLTPVGGGKRKVWERVR